MLFISVEVCCTVLWLLWKMQSVFREVSLKFQFADPAVFVVEQCCKCEFVPAVCVFGQCWKCEFVPAICVVGQCWKLSLIHI